MDMRLTSLLKNNEVEVTEKFFPSAAKLSTVVKELRCPETSCSQIFTSESNLNMHVLRKHKGESLQKHTFDRQFYCPERECVYNDVKFFKTLKLLKQHYLKIHSEKPFSCFKCEAMFSTKSAQKRHTMYCGIKFKCCDCDSCYPMYETLITHARRKKHRILEKETYKTSILKSSSGNQMKKLDLFISLRSQNNSTVNLLLLNKRTCEKSSQTEQKSDVLKFSKNTQVKEVFPKENTLYAYTQTEKKSVAIQTTHNLNKKFSSSQTQTVRNLFLESGSLNLLSDLDKKHNTTQTKRVSSHSKSCNTSFDDYYDFGEEVVKNSLGTQTSLNSSISTSTHYSIHTDTSDRNFDVIDSCSQTYWTEEMQTLDTLSFFNCNMETQTDFMLDNDLLNYSETDSTINSQTQTNFSNNNDLLEINALKECDILFSDIHTQTVFDDIFKSVESQTMFLASQNLPLFACRDYANIETQTETDFRNMLEQINA